MPRGKNKRKMPTQRNTPDHISDRESDQLANMIIDDVNSKTNTTKDLPLGARIAVVKSLREYDYSVLKLAEITGLNVDTVCSYLNKDIPDQFLRFSDGIKKIFNERQYILKAKAIEAATQKLSDLSQVRLFEINGLIKVLGELEGVQRENAKENTRPNTVINIHPALANREKVIEAEISD
jgi:hypothetical protein